MKSNTVSYAMGKRDNMISFRLNDDELVRVDSVIGLVLRRNPHLKKANVYRELIGVIETGMITKDERAYLRGEKELPAIIQDKAVNFVLLPKLKEEIPDMEIVRLLKAKTGANINTLHIAWYRQREENDKFSKLPAHIQEIITAYYGNDLDEHLQEREEDTG
jgi:hypothetical protein